MPRFERGVPGSNPGRSTQLILWPSGSGRLPDTEEVGGSIPPRITEAEVREQRAENSEGLSAILLLFSDLCSLTSVFCDAACGVAVARGPVKAEVMGFDSPRAALTRKKEKGKSRCRMLSDSS